MTDIHESETLGTVLNKLRTDAELYFDRAESLNPSNSDSFFDFPDGSDYYWKGLTPQVCVDAENLIKRLLAFAGQLINEVKAAPLASEADQRDIVTGIKVMRSALMLRFYRSWAADAIHDQGTILAIQPAGQSDDTASDPKDAKKLFIDWTDKIHRILDLVTASRGLGTAGNLTSSTISTKYRPGTAFIMMPMDKSQLELTDVSDTIKQVFDHFDIKAIRADDIEHEELITKSILNEIETSEFLFADMTHERPNVYYEVGYAHALKRRVILFRKSGTGLHFDLAGYNCPEYENLRDLREQLSRRLELLTNRKPKM